MVRFMSVHSYRNEDRFQTAYDMLGEAEKEKILRIRQAEGRCKSLGARILLRYVCGIWRSGAYVSDDVSEDEMWGEIQPSEVEAMAKGQPDPKLYFGERGKPFVKGGPQFSISHSGEYVGIAWNDTPIGLDIQRRDPGRSAEGRIARRFFTKEEQRMLEALSEEERNTLFYRIWCRKEAYGKYTGEGLSERVLSQNVLDENEEFFFSDFEKLKGYSVSVCRRKWI